MQRIITNSLSIKLSIIIILIESLVLASIGFYYTTRFSLEIDKRIEAQVQLPGILMNHQMLEYRSVSNKDIMSELVGEEFVDGIVFGTDKKVIYALNAEYEGKVITDIPEMNPDWIDNEKTATKIIRISSQHDTFLVSMTPLMAYEGVKPVFFVYIKVNTNRSEAQKTAIAGFFIVGSMCGVVLTSLLIIAFIRTFITRPLVNLERNASQLAKGNLKCDIETTRQDELGSLARSFGQLRNAIRQKIEQLEELNQTLEQKIKTRTQELQHNVKLLQQEIVEHQLTQKNLEKRTDELRKANEDLKELNRIKSEFLSTASHELRTPLTPIKQFIESFLSGMYGEVTEKQKIRAEMALTCVNDEARLVENLLDLVRIQENRVEVKREAENIADIVQSVIAVFEYDAREKGVKLTADIQEKEALVTPLDRGKIKQVMTNLVHNALKFTPQGGSITVSAFREDGSITVSVADTGSGIPEGQLEKIFDRFYQVDSSLTRKVGGTGIGLNIAQKYVELHDGKIWAESTVGEGTTFIFTLPRVEQTP